MLGNSSSQAHASNFKEAFLVRENTAPAKWLAPQSRIVTLSGVMHAPYRNRMAIQANNSIKMRLLN